MSVQQIAERCQQGDRNAFALLYSASRERLRSLCLRYVGSEAVADDLLHDAYILIFTRIGELKDTTRVEAWMQRVVRNVSLVYLRQQKQRQQLPLEAASMVAVTAATSQEYDDLMAAVSSLPDGYQQVFRLSVLEGMSHKQIAALLQIEPHSSSSQLYHAKALLRRWLAPMLLLLVTGMLLLVELDSPEGFTIEAPSTLPPKGEANPADEVTRKASPIRGEVGREPVSPIRGEVEVGLASPLRDEAEGGPEKKNAPVDVPEEKEMAEKQHDSHVQPLPSPAEVSPTHKRQHPAWNVSLAYTGLANRHFNGQLPYGDDGTSAATFDSISHHHLPITVGVTLSRGLNEHWQLSTGLQYSRLTTEMLSGNTYVSLHETQKVQYLGIPVSLSWYTPLARRWQLFASASLMAQLPLHATLSSFYLLPDGSTAEPTARRLHPGVQWSAGVGLGLQYDLAPHVSFFVEPSLQHFFRNGSGVSTWNTEHPLVFNVPFGLKISF